MDIEERQECAEQGMRNLMLMVQGQVMEVLGDDFDYEVLYPKNNFQWLNAEDAPDSILFRPTEMWAFTYQYCDKEAKDAIMEIDLYEPAIRKANLYGELGDKWDKEYLKARDTAVSMLREAKTADEIERAMHIWNNKWKQFKALDWGYVNPWIIGREEALAFARIEDMKRQRKSRWIARNEKFMALQSEKERRAAYVASHKEVVFKFNKEVVST